MPQESKLLKLLLAPLGLLSILYAWVLKTRMNFYRWGIYRTYSLPCKVVSVGNITLGGTGKTPLVRLLAEMCQKRGLRTAILSRGYRGKFRGSYGLVSDGKQILMDAAQAGDEPYLLAVNVMGVPVIVGRERWVSGQAAVDQFQTQVVILDDGFQHLSLKRDLNILLLDSSLPFGNEKIFPRGELREPLDQIARADAIILTKVGRDDNIINLKDKLAKLAGRTPVFQVDYRPVEIKVSARKGSIPPECLGGRKVLAFSGIARPESFQRTLLTLRASVVRWEVFPDHHEYQRNELARLQDEALRLGVEAMITTEKDLVRMKDFAPVSIPLWVLSVRHFFHGEDQSRFEALLWGRLGL